MDVSELRRGRRSGRRSGRLSDELNILSPPSEPETPWVRAALCASSCERVGRCGAPRGGGPRPRGGGPFSPREGRLGGGGGRFEGCRDGVFCAALSSRLRLFYVRCQQGVGVASTGLSEGRQGPATKLGRDMVGLTACQRGRAALTKRSSAKAVADFSLVDDMLPGDLTLGCCAGKELLLPELVLLLGSRKGFLEVGRGGGSSKGE